MSHVGIDGFPRLKEEDEQISQNVKALFGTDAGKAVLAYFRSITIDAVTGANISDQELRHLEGQRYFVGIIERRKLHAEKVSTDE